MRTELAVDLGTTRRLMKLAAVVAIGLLASGCAMALQRQVSDEVNAAKAACAARTFRNHVEKARCYNAAEQTIAAYYDKPDLLQLRLAARLAISERIDRGQITEAQGELEFAQIGMQIGSQEATRNSTAAMAAAATQIATPRSTTCNRIGNTVTCF